MNNVTDLHHRVKALKALASQAITTDATTTGEIIDKAGFEALEFMFLTKVLTDGTYTVTLFEGDESNMSDESAVSAEETLGSFSTNDTGGGTIGRVGYIGKKRYIRAKIVSTNTTTGVDIMSGIALLGNPKHQPQAEQTGA